jgi:membrane-bound serine protease (ClpP class)
MKGIRPVSRASLPLLLWLLSGAVPAQTEPASSGPGHVYVMPVDGTIDLGLAPFLDRTLRQAAEDGAAAVVLEINTFGGRVDAAVAMRDALLNSKVRTIAYINQRAISAGALIALATNTIVMVEGGTIGAATPVLSSGGGAPVPTDEKSVSYVRNEFRATAEVRKRPHLFAEAMVDADVVIPKVIEKGKLLTLTTAGALEHKIADFQAATLVDALAAAGLPNVEVRRLTETWAESLVRFITNPILSSFLLSLGLLGLLVEIRTPGFGVPGGLGLLSIGLFFYGHWLVRLAGWEELLLISIGIVLIALEIFVIPGFTIAGITGVVSLLAGLSLSLIGSGANFAHLIGAIGQVTLSLAFSLVVAAVLFRLLPHTPIGRRLVLSTGMTAEEGYVSAPASDLSWLGRQGSAIAPLRPSGIAEIEGHRLDVVSDGNYISAGSPVEVIRVDGNRIVVKALPATKVAPHE